MPLFYFALKAGRQIIPDSDGQELPDETAARAHAVAVAQQLMRHRENDTRNWRIQVCDDYLQSLFEVYFAEVDETLRGRPPGIQAAIANAARLTAGLQDAILDMQATLNDVRATLVRADRILATMPGRRVP